MPQEWQKTILEKIQGVNPALGCKMVAPKHSGVERRRELRRFKERRPKDGTVGRTMSNAGEESFMMCQHEKSRRRKKKIGEKREHWTEKKTWGVKGEGLGKIVQVIKGGEKIGGKRKGTKVRVGK